MKITATPKEVVYTVTMTEEELALVKTLVGRGVAWISPDIGNKARNMYDAICDYSKVEKLPFVPNEVIPHGCVPTWRAVK